MDNSEQNQRMTAEQVTAAIHKAINEALAPIIESVNSCKQTMSSQGKQANEPGSEGEVSEAVKQFISNQSQQDNEPEGQETREGINEATKQFLSYNATQPHKGKQF